MADTANDITFAVFQALKYMQALRNSIQVDESPSADTRNIKPISEYAISPVDIRVKQQDGSYKMIKAYTAPLMKAWFAQDQSRYPMGKRIVIMTAPVLLGNTVIVVGAAFYGNDLLANDYSKGSLNEPYGIEKLTTRAYLRVLRSLGYNPDLLVADDDMSIGDDGPALTFDAPAPSGLDPLADYGAAPASSGGGKPNVGSGGGKPNVIDIGDLPKTLAERHAKSSTPPAEPADMPDDDGSSDADDITPAQGGSDIKDPKQKVVELEL